MTEDEFRILAYVRAYSDHREQHLDPTWVGEQLVLSADRLRDAARGLAAKGLAFYFEYDPPAELRATHPELPPGPYPSDFCLTARGWDHLLRGEEP